MWFSSLKNTPNLMGGMESFVNLLAAITSKIPSLNLLSGTSLFGSQIRINFKEVLLVSIRV